MAIPVADSIVLLTAVNNNNGILTDEFISGLVQGGSWQFGGDPRVITYSFNVNDGYDQFGNLIPGSGGNWTAALIDAATRALAAWSSVANISFQNISSGTYYFQSSADIALTLTGSELLESFGAIGLAVFPDTDFGALVSAAGITPQEYLRPEGDVFLDNFYSGFYLHAGGLGFETFVHEIGHALGLKHPDDDGANDRPTFSELGVSPFDVPQSAIMSSNAVDPARAAPLRDATPMPLDILAIQYMYGANMSYRIGNDNYAYVYDPSHPITTIWDAGGLDTIDASGYSVLSNGVILDLRPGVGIVQPLITTGGGQIAANDGRIAIAYGVTIENAIGTAYNDRIISNDTGNILTGGSGDDTYVVGSLGDLVVETVGGGSDTVQSYVPWTLGVNIENLTLLNFASHGLGNDLANVITGNGSDNPLLRGLGGADTITGGDGNDWLEGESGNDLFAGVAGGDTLNGDAGDDTVLGGAGDDRMYGGAGVDFLIGETGDDVAYGGGDGDAIDGRQGSDVLFGEGGDDTLFGDGYFYLFGFSSDSLFGGPGNDIMMGEAGEPSALGSGDVIYGEDGDDLLDGAGGDDAIYGGNGNDVIDGDHGNDTIVGGQGTEIMLGSNAVAYGGPTEGSDLFVYQAMTDGGDNIYGFDLRPGLNDGIDLRPLFDALGYAGTTPRAAGYLYVFQNGANTDVYVDANGAAGGANLTLMLTLVGVTATSLTDSYFLFQ